MIVLIISLLIYKIPVNYLILEENKIYESFMFNARPEYAYALGKF